MGKETEIKEREREREMISGSYGRFHPVKGKNLNMLKSYKSMFIRYDKILHWMSIYQNHFPLSGLWTSYAKIHKWSTERHLKHSAEKLF